MGWLRFLPTRLIFSIWVLFRKLYPKWSLIRTCFWSERLGLALDQNMTKYWQRWDSERHVYHRGGGLLRHPCWVTSHSAFLVAHPTSGTAWLGKGVGKGGWVVICKVTLFFMGEGHCFNTGLSYIIPESLYLVGCCKSSGNTPPPCISGTHLDTGALEQCRLTTVAADCTWAAQKEPQCV